MSILSSLKIKWPWFLSFLNKEYDIDTSGLSEVLSRKFASEPDPEELTGDEKALSEYLKREALISEIMAKRTNSLRFIRG